LIARSASVGQKPSSGTLAVRVYPNPALGVAHINVEELPKGLPASVYVVDEAGEIVAALYEGTPSGDIGLRLSLDCAKLASGIYYVHVQNAVMGRAVRFVVMR
jgi:hypothetical protein